MGEGAARGEGEEGSGGGVLVSIRSADGLVKMPSVDGTNYCAAWSNQGEGGTRYIVGRILETAFRFCDSWVEEADLKHSRSLSLNAEHCTALENDTTREAKGRRRKQEEGGA